MFSKSLRAAFVSLTILTVSISATQSLSVKVTGMFQVFLHLLYIHFSTVQVRRPWIPLNTSKLFLPSPTLGMKP